MRLSASNVMRGFVIWIFYNLGVASTSLDDSDGPHRQLLLGLGSKNSKHNKKDSSKEGTTSPGSAETVSSDATTHRSNPFSHLRVRTATTTSASEHHPRPQQQQPSQAALDDAGVALAAVKAQQHNQNSLHAPHGQGGQDGDSASSGQASKTPPTPPG
eukprot:CAMPEP_0171741804 /NCGR_PEP_ID=MMETSP0991-20121206/35802_1 /TAXON_ID=483369 /ORGANISM="non described non described, Strain CCMP2098" /LENGTH=157 /DNA_ID=CAMNT_0012340193 /DNA_START=19 /DNA_END=488 /DNA_ORIENTATION=-